MRPATIVLAILAALAVRAAAAPEEEAPKRTLKQRVLAQADVNGDGKLAEWEKGVACRLLGLEPDRARREGRRGPGRRGGPAGDGPRGRPPRPTREEILRKYDADGNGVLDPEERAKAREDLRKAREERRKTVAELRKEVLGKYDADGDGKLSGEEKAAARKALGIERLSREEILEKYDADGDGKLSGEERAKAAKELGLRPPRRIRGAPGRGPAGGPPRPSREEILEKYDANGNGVLDPEELEKLREDLRKRRGRRGAPPGNEGR